MRGLEDSGSGGLLQGIIGLGPVLTGDAVAVHEGLGKSAAGQYLYVEDAIGTDLYFQDGSSVQFHLVDRVGLCSQANDEQLGCQGSDSPYHGISFLLVRPLLKIL